MSLQTERALFDACVELAAEIVRHGLPQHCADPALRERVHASVASPRRGRSSRRACRARRPSVTAASGRYRLLERIGEGAMGEVYLAEQSAPVRRRVALKIIKPGMDSREVIARFEIERQTLALMSHPNIAHIIEAGTTRCGAAVLRNGVRARHPAHQVLRRHRLTHRSSGSRCSCRSATPCSTRIRKA